MATAAIAGPGILAIAVSHVSWAQKTAFLAALLGSCVVGWRRHLVPDGPRVVRRLLYDRYRGWRVIDGRGDRRRVVPARGTFVTPWLVLLWLRAPNRRRFLVALAGAEARQPAARRLRVVLRCGPTAWS